MLEADNPTQAMSAPRARNGSVATFLLLVSLLFSLAFSTGTAGDEELLSTPLALAKLVILVGHLLLGLAMIAISGPFRRRLGQVTLALLPLVLYYVLAAALLPFSVRPSYSMVRLVLAVVQFTCILLLATHFLHRTTDPLREFTKDLIWASVVMLVASLLFMAQSGGLARIGPTGGVIHPAELAVIYSFSIMAALLYRRSFPVSRGTGQATLFGNTTIVDLGRLFILLVGSVIFLVLQTRGAMASLVLGMLLVLIGGFLSGGRGQGFILIVLVLIGSAAALFLSEPITNFIMRGQTVEDISSGTGRTEIWRELFQGMDAQSLLTGFGFSISFRTFSLKILNGEVFGTHQAFLQCLASLGIGGLLLMLIFLLRALWAFLAGMGRRTEGAFLGAAFVLNIIVTGLSESTFGTNPTTSFAIFMAYVAIYQVRTRAAAKTLRLTNRAAARAAMPTPNRPGTRQQPSAG